MNTRRSNRSLVIISIFMGIIGVAIISNVLFTMVTHKHLRTGTDINEVKNPDITGENVLTAKRGAIYDRSGEVIASDESTYNLIAILSKTRIGLKGVPAFVQDIKKTARLIAPIVGVKEETLEKKLEEAKKKNLYQTEFGASTKNLSKSQKEQIVALDLPGIVFVETVKRDYPTGKFASHLIGYAQYDETSGHMKGKMGLEAALDKYLEGKNGLEIYQKDSSGNVLPGTKYTKSYATDGNNVVLTLDHNVQQTLQTSLDTTLKKTDGAKRGWGIVMEVDTGKILGWASSPEFDLNKRDVKEYLDYPADYLYEPGSVMKGITYAAAIDSGNYPYNKTFTANAFYYKEDANGKIYRTEPTKNGPYIQDAEGEHLNTITFDKGFAESSNIGICELLTNYMKPEIYKDYVKKFNFLKKVDIPYISNQPGSMSFTYASEKLSTGFGQAININALQMVQAYTAILNDGKMMRPYVVDRIEDANSNKVIEQYSPKQIGTPISKKTSDYLKKLMRMVVTEGTGKSYDMKDVKVIAKTGTGQIANQPGGYGGPLHTSSVMLAAPADKPKVMVYYAFEGTDIRNFSREPMKDVMRAALVAANIAGETETESEKKTTKEWKQYTMPSLLNHTLDYANEKLKGKKINKVVIGNGTSIVKQYPEENQTIISNQNIFLLTDGSNLTMPDMKNWTKKDITAFWDMTHIEVEMKGTGKVTSQNIKAGNTINKESKITVKME